MTPEIRVGLIGYGFAGRAFHAPVITSVPNLQLAAVVERRTAYSKQRYPWVKVVTSVEQLYQDDTIDLVVVTTPSTDHLSFVRDALLAGKHVVVEKPFTVTADEADQLIALAGQQNRVLSVFHNRRWDGDFLTIQELLAQGLLGQPIECTFRWDGYSPVARSGNWRDTAAPGAGVVYDLGVHFLDQALTLFGAPETITADIRIQRDGAQAHDYFDIALGYASQLKVVLKSSKFVREPSPRYTLYGTKGTYIKYGMDPQEAALIQGQSPASTPQWGQEPRERWGKLITSLGNLQFEGAIQTRPGSYQSYYQNVYDAITGQAELAVKPEQARQAVRLIELALQSAAERRQIEVG
jgi:scyllo-inositol 2-dehydrogenase (NADP+)